MNNKIKLFFLFLFSASISLAQEINLDIHNTSLKEYISIEQQLGSTLIPTTSNHVSFSGNAQPIKYQRKQDLIPDLIVYYYFKEKDSTISHILYEWDVRHFKTQEERYAKESVELERGLISKYNELEKKITNQFGESTVTGDLTEFENVNQKGGLQKKNIWTPDDSTEIEMYTTISNYYERNGAITTAPTHRIRLYVRSIKQNQQAEHKLEASDIELLTNTTFDFLEALKKKRYIKAKYYLSDLIASQTTAEQLEILSESIDDKRNLETFYTGVQVGLNGQSFSVLHLKYSDDSSNPPKEMIKVLYDTDNKIIGMQPIKLMNKK
jgi:hypothetical protein